ncbi:YhjD/YihY/BrkB family envelope integrity protein [Fidelibacter multiformis]|uniref:YhjD/YihY/BrkB family envelope integrity protein n=1 Tax=Fidelibacter multiformis TaxID=3377529 RepID=UPI0037DD85E6
MISDKKQHSGLLQRFIKRVITFFRFDENESGPVRNILYKVDWVTTITFKKFKNDLCFEQAASLAFITVISLIPLSVLFFSIAGVLGVGQEIINYVQDRVFPFVAPEFQQELSGWLNTYISPTAFRGIKSGIISLIAIVSLLLAAMAVFVMAERVFNHIWKVQERRSYLQKVVAFWVVLTTSPFLILMSIWLMNYINPPGGMIDQLIQSSWFFRLMYNNLVPLGISFAAFTLAYIIVPSISVKFKYAAWGGLITAMLWELSKKTFYLYVAQIGHVTNFYKSLATIPLFLMWVYLTWVLVLWGAELSHTFQNMQILRRIYENQGRERFYSKHYLAAMILVFIGKAFRQGNPVPTLDDIGQKAGIRIEVLDEVAQILVQKHFIFPDTSQNGSYFLGKDPRHIYLSDVVRCVHVHEFPAEARIFPGGGLRRSPENDPVMLKLKDVFVRAYGAMTSGFAAITLDSILNSDESLPEPDVPEEPKQIGAHE